MADTAPKLWCLIKSERDTAPFSVPAFDVSIHELKKIIQNEIKVDLAAYDAYRLNLWKVRHF